MKLNYCPECAAPLQKQSETKYTCANSHDYFNNPRVAVTIIFLNAEGQALYAKRAREPKKGYYDFPGGFADFGETPEEAIRREIREETGLENVELIAISISSSNVYAENTSTCDFVFICDKWEGEITPQDDVETLEWKPLEFMESDAFAWKYNGLREELARYLSKNHL